MSAGSTASGSSNDGAESDFSLNEAESEDGRTWDRTRRSCDPQRTIATDFSCNFQGNRGAADPSPDRLGPTRHDFALGQQLDKPNKWFTAPIDEADDAPLGSA